MLFLRKIIILLLIAAALSFTACSTTSKAASSEEERPDWIDNYPVDNAYYIGVGSSNTGDKSSDMETAKAKALTDLASAISVQISSEQSFVVKEDSKGNAFQSAEVQINQAVSNHFKDVEVTDSFYSEKSGYWFYYRLSKAKWAAIQAMEKMAIDDRVKSLITPVYENPETTSVDKISSLAKSWNIVVESPYEGTIDSTFKGESGKLIDLVEMNMGRVTKDLVIETEPSSITTEPGRYENIRLSVKNRSGEAPGQIKIGFYNKKDNMKCAEIVTDRDGNYSGKIKFTSLPTGKSDVSAEIALDEFGLTPDMMKSSIITPEKQLKIQMNHISVLLTLKVNGEYKIESLKDSVKSLFSRDDFAVKLSEGGKNERFAVVFSMYFRNLPENSYGVFLTKAKASISLSKEGSNIYSYESKEYKEGGLDWDQAQERAVIKLFRDINADERFISQIKDAIYKAAQESTE